jgi:hypothetical protein
VYQVELIGNTLIFMLAGIIIGDLVYNRNDEITGADYMWLLVLYVLLTLVRLVVVFFFFPVLRNLGPGEWDPSGASVLNLCKLTTVSPLSALDPNHQALPSTRPSSWSGVGSVVLLV